MPKKNSVKGWPLMKAKCKTCPFGTNGDPLLRESVTERLLRFNSSQQCHHPILHGKKETHLCRGGRDLQLQVLANMGLIEDATDAAFTKRSRELGVIE